MLTHPSRIHIKRTVTILTLVIVASATILSLPVTTFASATESRLLLLPFDLNAPQEQSHLRQGVMAMLQSRLTVPGEIQLIKQQGPRIEPSPITQETALKLARNSSADYILLGSVSLFGQHVSCDALLLNAEHGTLIKNLSLSGKSIETLPDQIEQLTGTVREAISGAHRMAAPAAVVPEAKPVLPEAKVESALQGELSASNQTGQEFKIDMNLGGIASGDVDGDGRNEICVISNRRLTIYRLQEGQLNKLASLDTGNASTLLSVEIIDLNGNGRAEMFVSSFHEFSQNLNSFVAELDSDQITRTADRLRWFFRAIPANNKGGSQLVGQQMGSDRVFSRDGIFEFNWDGNKYQAGKQVGLPAALPLYGFTFGDLYRRGAKQTVTINNDQQLSILSVDGSLIWQSRDRDYGGSTTSINIDPARLGRPATSHSDRYRVYLKQDILSADWNKDSHNEIIVARNKNSISKSLSQSRKYESGSIDVISWRDNKPFVLWTTGRLKGFFRDYLYDDITNDGVPELVTIYNRKQDGLKLFSKPESYVRIWTAE